MVLLEMYLSSRCKHGENCPECKTYPGTMEDSQLQLQDASGKTIDLLKLTCNRCRYTMLFDLDVALSHPPDKGVNETFPSWVNEFKQSRQTTS
jgi:hypothetical protein